MPWPTRPCAGSAMRSTSPKTAVPVAGIAPISARSSVVLPAPLRPMSPHISPVSMARLAPRMIGIGPIETSRPDTLSMAALPPRPRPADEQLDPGIGEGDGRGPVGDHGAVVEGEHAVGIALDDLHVVLDEQHREPAAPQRRHYDLHDAEL